MSRKTKKRTLSLFVAAVMLLSQLAPLLVAQFERFLRLL